MKTLIVAAGELPSDELVKEKLGWCDLSIAADGGLCSYDSIDAVPDIIVGDMDSIDEQLLEKFCAKGSECVLFESEKNDTDTFLALETAINAGASITVLLGATGKRIDHLLSNIMLLKWCLGHGHKLVIEDDFQTIEIGCGEVTVSGEVGQTVSLLPMDDSVTVTAHGLQYPLEELKLTNSRPRGISNVLQKEKASLHTDKAVLIIKNKVVR